MPRYTQVTPTFTPVDYQTRIAPLEQYKDEYDKRLDKIEEQGLLADAIGGLIDENTDPELMDTYRDYSNRMQQTAKNLLDSGDLRSSRQSLIELRRDYANKLVPIQQAFNTRAEAAKSYREQKAKDPTYIGTDPLEHGLKDYMNGKMPNDKTASGAALYTLGQNASKAASGREIRETAWALDRKLGNQFFTKIKQEGWKQDEVMYALENLAMSDDKSISEDARKLIGFINDTVSNIHSINDIDSFADKRNRDASDGWILRGVIDGIGYKQEEKQQTYTPYKNEIAYYNLQEAKYKTQKAKADYERTVNTTKTDKPFKSGSDKYQPKGNIKLVDRALNPLSANVSYKGTKINNAIQAYEQLHVNDNERASVQDRIDEIKNNNKYEVVKYADGYIVREKVEERNKNNLPVTILKQNDELTREFNNLQQRLYDINADDRERSLIIKPFALSDKEYRQLAEMAGTNTSDFTTETLLNKVINNIDYAAEAQTFNRQKIADDGITKKLKDEMCIAMQTEIKGGKSDLIYETEDGYTPSRKAAKVSREDFEPEDVLSIEMSPFTASSGMVLVKKKKGDKKGQDGKTYLVPAYILGNEGGSDIITAGLINPEDNRELWNTSLAGSVKDVVFGPHQSSVRERLELADDKIHEAISAIQRNFLQNHPQAWSTNITKGQGELPIYTEE